LKYLVSELIFSSPQYLRKPSIKSNSKIRWKKIKNGRLVASL